MGGDAQILGTFPSSCCGCLTVSPHTTWETWEEGKARAALGPSGCEPLGHCVLWGLSDSEPFPGPWPGGVLSPRFPREKYVLSLYLPSEGPGSGQALAGFSAHLRSGRPLQVCGPALWTPLSPSSSHRMGQPKASWPHSSAPLGHLRVLGEAAVWSSNLANASRF